VSQHNPELEREALDPSIAPARLAELLSKQTEHALRNLSLPLLRMEQPDFWTQLSGQACKDACTSLRQPHLPAESLARIEAAEVA
jgi:hypothetical protein